VRGSEDFASIAVAFKRIKNILRQAGEHDREERRATSIGIEFNNPDLFEAGAERELAMAIPPLHRDIQELARQKKYGEALARVAGMRRPVDTFFDKIMVMVDDKAVRTRRIMVLFFFLASVSNIADFGEIVTEGK
jgi:glycyl-tRNA synthetase beta chain